MDSKELDQKIRNLQQAITTMNDLLVELRKQQIILKREESEKQELMKKHAVHTISQEEPITKQPQVTQIVQAAKVEKVDSKREFDLLKLCQIWLPRIFIGIMLLGVVWLFKAGMDAGILTPPLRLLFGILLAGVLYWFGNRQVKANRSSLGLVLLGGSVASLVLTTFAAHYLYEYLPATVAFLFNVLWIIVGIFIAHLYNSEYLAIFVAIGGFFVPFLINSSDPNVYVFLGYETLLTISLLVYAAKKLHRILYIVAYVIAQLILFVFFAFTQLIDEQMKISVIYAIFQLLLFYQLLKNHNFIYSQRLGVMAFNGTVLVMSLMNLEKGSAICLLASAIAYFIFSYYEWKKDKNSTLSTITFALAMFTTCILISNEFERNVETILYLVQGGIAIYLGYLLKNKWKALIGVVFYSIGLLMTLSTSIFKLVSTEFFAHMLLVASFAFLLYKVRKDIMDKSSTLYKALFYSFMFILFIFFTKIGGAVSEDSDVNSLIISFLWMVYASLTIWYGRLKNTIAIFRKNEMIYIGLVVLFITVGKLFLIDLVMVSMTIRAILFLIIGAIGVGISRLFFINK